MRLEGDLVAFVGGTTCAAKIKTSAFVGASKENGTERSAFHRLPGRAMCDGPFDFVSKPANDDGSNGFLPHSPRGCPSKIENFVFRGWIGFLRDAGKIDNGYIIVGSLVVMFSGIFG